MISQILLKVTTPLAIELTYGVTYDSAHGAPVTPDYQPPIDFAGKIYSVTVDVSGKLIEDKEAETRIVLIRQKDGTASQIRIFYMQSLSDCQYEGLHNKLQKI